MIKVIAEHELRVLLRSPFAWIAAALLQLIFGWLFLAAVDQFTTAQTQIASSAQQSGLTAYLVVHFIAPSTIIMMLATPLLCMGTIAGERQSGRFALLASSPVTPAHIVTGKFTGALLFQYAVILLSMLLIAALLPGIALDLFHLLTAYLGLALFIAVATAVTLLFSSLTKRPVLAAFLSFSVLLMSWLAAQTATGMLSVVSPSSHLNSFMQGLFDSRDFAYFICTVAILLCLCTHRLATLIRNSSTASPKYS
ncbi:hypothetical protein AB833_29935 [Chromatiales bacterium (ex Bugula neritina AB1)]|nr:hypothetical protein AB833_29935 [Chromatiales bacterium (ex Bugula neritina AB1)]